MSARALTVQFFVYRNVHWPMFEELFTYLGTRREVAERVICLPSLDRLKNGSSGALIERLLGLDATITAHPAEGRADITFIADTVAGLVRDCGVIVNVGHGTISKGFYFTDSVWTERENWVDLLCVPGAYAAERFARLLRTRVVATGMPKLDPVFGGRCTRAALCERLAIDPARRIVLYAPTFNEDLSSVYLFAERFAELAAPDRVLLVKLHGSTRRETVDAYRALAARTPGVVFVDDPNIAPSLGGADAMISDVSSVTMEFMALDKPVILFDNPAMERYHGYNPADIEHAWRDLATRADTFDGIKSALGGVLAAGDGKSALRRMYAERLFADRTGGASARVWAAAVETLEAAGTAAARRPRVPRISLLVHLTPDNLFLARRMLADAALHAVMPIELLLVQQGTSPAVESYVRMLTRTPPFAAVRVARVEGNDADATLTEAARAATGSYILVARPAVLFQKGFDYFLHQTFAAHPEINALTGVSWLEGDADRRKFEREPIDGMAPERAAYHFINWYGGKAVAPFRQPAAPPMLIFRRGLMKFMPASLIAGLDALSANGHVRVAPSVCYALVPTPLLEQCTRYLAASGVERLQLALRVFRSGAFLLAFPDVARALVKDLVAAGATEPEIAPLLPLAVGSACHEADTCRELRDALSAFPALRATLESEAALLDRFLSRATSRRTSAGDHRSRPDTGRAPVLTAS